MVKIVSTCQIIPYSYSMQIILPNVLHNLEVCENGRAKCKTNLIDIVVGCVGHILPPVAIPPLDGARSAHAFYPLALSAELLYLCL